MPRKFISIYISLDLRYFLKPNMVLELGILVISCGPSHSSVRNYLSSFLRKFHPKLLGEGFIVNIPLWSIFLLIFYVFGR